MAYPTTLSFQQSNPQIGLQPIASTSTTQNHPLGTICRASDYTYGEGEFIYLKGVASTAAGDAVTYDPKGATVRAVATSVGPIAIAMSASVTLLFGWYQISGAGVVNSSGATTATVPGTSSTAGQLNNTGTAKQINGARFSTAQDAPGAGFTGIVLDRPSCSLLG